MKDGQIKKIQGDKEKKKSSTIRPNLKFDKKNSNNLTNKNYTLKICNLCHVQKQDLFKIIG